ncbi:hypothetical protein NKI39_15790 [Mesorhizobium sp. M0664]|uniref:hypothetical protein n=1 Tax=Mesorhizobium sp. M0664 TaxID=2956982 RepID=UPI00333D2EE0
MADLQAEFTLAMFDIYRRAKSEAKYNAIIFLQMVTDNGGHSTAKTLITPPNRQMGTQRYIFESASI